MPVVNVSVSVKPVTSIPELVVSNFTELLRYNWTDPVVNLAAVFVVPVIISTLPLDTCISKLPLPPDFRILASCVFES